MGAATQHRSKLPTRIHLVSVNDDFTTPPAKLMLMLRPQAVFTRSYTRRSVPSSLGRSFLQFTRFCPEICFVAIHPLLCLEKKLSKNCFCREKITNIRYEAAILKRVQKGVLGSLATLVALVYSSRQHQPQTMVCGRDEDKESFEPSGSKSMFAFKLVLSPSRKNCIQ